jgi:ubiquinone/menaquinone biosynthesis C-methylase UbiE
LKVYSSDIDPILRHGLRDYGAEHSVASVEKLPFDAGFFDAVVTEAPFDENTTPIVAKGLEELARVTTPKASIVMMTGENQADFIRKKAIALNLESYIDQSVDRKGTPVHIFGWKKKFKIK